MRFSILADKNGRPIINSADYHHAAQMFLNDRFENKESFPGERVVRLPRKLCSSKFWERSAIISRLNQWTIK
jgi:hypothetical protein